MFATKRFVKLVWGLPAALLLMAAVQPAHAQVDCDRGGSVQRQLDRGDTFVEFTGTCDEEVFIPNDSTLIVGVSGDPARDVITGNVLAFGIKQIFLEGFTINGILVIDSSADVFASDLVLRGGATINASGDVSVFGSTVTDTGSVAIVGNSRVSVNGTTIDDLRGDVFVTDGARALFENTDITNTDFGVFVGRNASLNFRNGRMGPALIDDADVSCNPLCAVDNASIRLNDVVVEGTNNDPNIGGAISLSRNSSLVLRGESVVTNNGSQPAVGVFNDSSFRQDGFGDDSSRINGDVQVANMSFADFRAADISGNVEVDLHSVFRLGSAAFGGNPENTLLTGNSTIGRDSAFVVEDPRATINGEITCLDRESSFAGDFTGKVKFNKCTDFDGKKVDDDDDD